MNCINLVGRLTKPADLRYTPAGKAVAAATLAVNNPYKKGEADFINLVFWEKKAEALANNTQKGSRIGVTGRLSTRNYEGSDGKRVYVTEVVVSELEFLDTKPEAQQPEPITSGTHRGQAPQEGPTIQDDDLPF